MTGQKSHALYQEHITSVSITYQTPDSVFSASFFVFLAVNSGSKTSQNPH